MVTTSDNFGKLNQNVKSLVDGLNNQFRKLGGQIGSVISDEMTETSDTLKTGFGFMKSSGISSLNFFQKTFALDGLRLKWQKKNFKMLETQVNLAKQERKSRLSTFKGGKKGGLLETLLMWFGLPMLWLTKGITALKGIFTFFKKLIPFEKILDKFKTWKLPKWTRFEGLRKMFTSIKKIPGIATLGKITKGLGKFVWWVGLALEIADFYSNYKKGFEQTQGDFDAKLKGGLKAGIEGFITSYGKMLSNANTWLSNQMGVEDITKNSTFRKTMTSTKNIMTQMLLRMLTPSNQNLDALMSDMELSKKGEIDKWFLNFGEKLKALPGLMWDWFKNLSVVKGINDAWNYFTGNDKKEVSESGGQLVRQKINDTRFDNLEKVNQKYFQDNWSKVNKNVELQQGIYQEMKTNNEYQRKIFEKETPAGDFHYSPPQQSLAIPDRSENRDISQMTSTEIGYTF